MLLQYIVSNFKSIGHPVEFSMFPSEGNLDERFLKTLSTHSNGTLKVLRRGGFFGPNASGKSSFIESIAFARDFVVNGRKSGKGTKINQFKGNFSDLEGLSTFQFVFYLDERVYEYGFSVDRQQVHEEWLLELMDSDFVTLFTRATDRFGKTEIDIEPSFAPVDSAERRLAEVLKATVQENQRNQLFLYKLFDNGIKRAEHIVEWFTNLQIILPSTKVIALPLRMKENEDLQKYISEMLCRMDTGVSNVSVASEKMDLHDFAEKMHIPKEIIEDIENISSGSVTIDGQNFVFIDGKEKGPVVVRQTFEHMLNGHAEPFDIEEESDGTQRLLDLLPMLYSIRENKNLIYFVDEIDRSLHTKLSQFLLSEFANNCEDTNNQIIFTAHDVNLINTDSFRQEEIWFIDKNRLGESYLRSLSDFNLQDGQNALKAYLNGRFGAIPTIRRRC